MDTQNTTPKRRLPQAFVVGAVTLGLAAGGYGIASAASEGGATTPTTTVQAAPAPATGIQQGEAPTQTPNDEGNERGNGAPCDHGQRGSSTPGQTPDAGTSDNNQETPSASEAGTDSLTTLEL